MRLPCILFLAFLSASYAVSLPFLERQDVTKGRCPSEDGEPGRICGINQSCCPNRCCPKNTPFCGEGQCLTADGFVRCPTEGGGTRRGRLCSNDPSFCCVPPYGFCSQDEPVRCINADGFIACKDSTTGKVSDGQLCPNGICCVLPRKCCEGKEEGTFVCCETKGDDIRLERAPVVRGERGASPVPFATPDATGPEQEPTQEEEEPTPDGPSAPEVPENGMQTTPEDGGTEISPGAEMSPDVDDGAGQPDQSGGDEDDGSVCLPGDAKVEIRGKGITEVANVRSGDLVRVGGGEWSEVFMWTHRDASYRGRRYVEVWADGMLKVTEGHMVYICRGMREGCEKEIVSVENVRVGDGMWRLENEERLVRVDKVMRGVNGWGLYNPQTASGDIVVDGVLITCYSRWIKESVAHGLLAPIRALYKWSGFALEVSL